MTGAQEPDPRLGEFEWLDGRGLVDAGGPGGPGGPRGRPRVPRAAWYALLAGAFVAVLVVRNAERPNAKHQALPTLTLPASLSASSAAAPPSIPPVTVRRLGHPLLSVPRGVELFAAGGGVLLRIELAAGRITRTVGVDLASSAPAYLVAGPHEAIVKSFDVVPGYLVPDGRAPQPLPGALAGPGGVFPGPDADHVWISDPTGADQARTELVGLDGRPTGTTLRTGADLSDGTGYLLSVRTGGTYEVRPGSVRRITSGAVLAGSATRWLTKECDAHARCTLDVVDRRTQVRHVVRPAADADPGGSISPDGRFAAIPRGNGARRTVHLIDLATGADRPTSVEVSGNNNGPALVWTPDGRWLLVADADGRVDALDRSGHARAVSDGDEQIGQLALRVS